MILKSRGVLIGLSTIWKLGNICIRKWRGIKASCCQCHRVHAYYTYLPYIMLINKTANQPKRFSVWAFMNEHVLIIISQRACLSYILTTIGMCFARLHALWPMCNHTQSARYFTPALLALFWGLLTKIDYDYDMVDSLWDVFSHSYPTDQ